MSDLERELYIKEIEIGILRRVCSLLLCFASIRGETSEVNESNHEKIYREGMRLVEEINNMKGLAK